VAHQQVAAAATINVAASWDAFVHSYPPLARIYMLANNESGALPITTMKYSSS
jgi:hypothetical protein